MVTTVVTCQQEETISSIYGSLEGHNGHVILVTLQAYEHNLQGLTCYCFYFFSSSLFLINGIKIYRFSYSYLMAY